MQAALLTCFDRPCRSDIGGTAHWFPPRGRKRTEFYERWSIWCFLSNGTQNMYICSHQMVNKLHLFCQYALCRSHWHDQMRYVGPRPISGWSGLRKAEENWGGLRGLRGTEGKQQQRLRGGRWGKRGGWWRRDRWETAAEIGGRKVMEKRRMMAKRQMGNRRRDWGKEGDGEEEDDG